jgi:hypothetical protein
VTLTLLLLSYNFRSFTTENQIKINKAMAEGRRAIHIPQIGN